MMTVWVDFFFKFLVLGGFCFSLFFPFVMALFWLRAVQKLSFVTFSAHVNYIINNNNSNFCFSNPSRIYLPGV